MGESMTLKSQQLKTLLFLFTVLTVFVSQPSNAAYYKFSLSGFDGIGTGGRMTGSFKAQDVATNSPDRFSQSKPIPDGIIYYCPRNAHGCWDYDANLQYNDVIKEFNIFFSGNSFFDKLNQYDQGKLELLILSGNNLRMIVYPSLVGVQSFGFARADLDKSNDDGRGYEFYFVDGNTGGRLRTIEDFRVSQVPLPGALNLFIMGLALLYIARWKTPYVSKFWRI